MISKLLAFGGRLLVLGIIFLLPLISLAVFHDRIQSKSLRWLVSIVAVDLSFFLCAFVGLHLDPSSQHLSTQERLATSLVVVAVLTLAIAVVIPLRRAIAHLVQRFFSR
jgi:hypothetical protein